MNKKSWLIIVLLSVFCFVTIMMKIIIDYFPDWVYVVWIVGPVIVIGTLAILSEHGLNE